MPVIGPNQNFAYSQGDNAFKEVLDLLKTKYHAERPTELLPFGKEYAKQWDDLANRLHETIKEMIWVDHSASF